MLELPPAGNWEAIAFPDYGPRGLGVWKEGACSTQSKQWWKQREMGDKKWVEQQRGIFTGFPLSEEVAWAWPSLFKEGHSDKTRGHTQPSWSSQTHAGQQHSDRCPSQLACTSDHSFKGSWVGARTMGDTAFRLRERKKKRTKTKAWSVLFFALGQKIWNTEKHTWQRCHLLGCLIHHSDDLYTPSKVLYVYSNFDSWKGVSAICPCNGTHTPWCSWLGSWTLG